MARLTRVTNKVFGATASIADDPLYGPQIGQFGSAKAGTYNATADVATIQGLSAWGNGWIDAVIPNQQYPTLPEMTGFGKVVTHQTGYILQEGIPEWDAGTTYYKNSIVKYASNTSTPNATASIGDSTGITDASVDTDTFISQISIDGNYTFTYNGSTWLYNEIATNLTLYGITITGTPVQDDEIIITLLTTITINETELYVSLTDDNINNNPNNDTVNWKKYNYMKQDVSNIDNTNNIASINLNNAGIRTVIETYVNGTSWYRVWSDGWCEQGGIASKLSQNLEIYLFKSYTDTNYSVLISPYYLSNDPILHIDGVNEKYTNYFNVRSNNYINTNQYKVTWQTKGYIS